MNIHYFFRKKQSHFHSIENLFTNLQYYLPNSCHFVNINLPCHNGILGRIKNIFFAKKTKAQINHITGDVNYIAIGLPRQNTILTIHDVFSALKGNFIKKNIIKFFWFTIPLKKVKYITTISQTTKNQVIKVFKVDKNKIFVIPNCFDQKFLNPTKDFNKQCPRILFVGTKWNKNLERTIVSLYNIKCVLIIIGKLTTEQINLLNKYKIKYENYFEVDQDQLIEIYKNSDMLLFPSTNEGFGMPIIEAQAASVPVITSNIEPMKQVAGNGALLVDPYDAISIKNAVEKIINDDVLRKKIVEQGSENVKNYHPSAISEKYYQLYKKILDEQ
mgnify:CR=1 FL=1